MKLVTKSSNSYRIDDKANSGAKSMDSKFPQRCRHPRPLGADYYGLPAALLQNWSHYPASVE